MTGKRVESIDGAGFHIRISDVFGDRTGGDHIAVKPIWYYIWLLTVTIQSLDLVTRIVGWIA